MAAYSQLTSQSQVKFQHSVPYMGIPANNQVIISDRVNFFSFQLKQKDVTELLARADDLASQNKSYQEVYTAMAHSLGEAWKDLNTQLEYRKMLLDQSIAFHQSALQVRGVNTLRPRQNGRRFSDDTFKHIFFKENVRISIKISLKFVPKGQINNIPALV